LCDPKKEPERGFEVLKRPTGKVDFRAQFAFRSLVETGHLVGLGVVAGGREEHAGEWFRKCCEKKGFADATAPPHNRHLWFAAFGACPGGLKLI
jgi:hypothetical protein